MNFCNASLPMLVAHPTTTNSCHATQPTAVAHHTSKRFCNAALLMAMASAYVGYGRKLVLYHEH